MESRMVKFYSKESNMVAIHAIPGHFATSHSHINYYIDITSLKTRIQEAKEVARVLHQKIGRVSYVDTIVCMDGTEVIGAFLAEEFEKEDMASTNRRYYGGVIEAVASVFSTVSEMDGFAVHSVFHAEDLPGYAAYSADDCPFCKKGIKLDAVVNGFGYSKL